MSPGVSAALEAAGCGVSTGGAAGSYSPREVGWAEGKYKAR